MKLPLSWLRDFVAFDDDTDCMAEKLTSSGMEVEAVSIHGAGLEDIVAAEIRAVEPHPKAERLKICRVFDGCRELNVVCGADNYQAGDIAVLAAAGVRLPGGQTIGNARLRGVMSEGMLCAPDELGLYDDHGGIMILPPETRPGVPLPDIIGPPETVFTIAVTPNRGDCLSIIGMAREVAALYRLPLRRPPVADCGDGGGKIGDHLRVTVEDRDGCPRYTALLIKGCRVGRSPAWMQRRLTMCGLRPINNIVDITNYVMLECGQPLHAFDLKRLHGGHLVVRRAREREVLAMLDETSRSLDPAMLVIADQKQAVAVAGVMGGEGSGIDDTTTTVALESAFFNPPDVRRTARNLGVASEASYRFERGVDPELCAWAGRRAALLLSELAGAQCVSGAIDMRVARPPIPAVRLRPERVRAVLGCKLADVEMVAILEALQFRVEEDSPGVHFRVTPPSFRLDVSLEEDLIEEIARLHGLDRIPTPAPFAHVIPDADDRPIRDAIRCRERLAGMGLQEIINYSFVSGKFLDIFKIDDQRQRLVIPNPVSADHAVMRPALIPQMVDTLGRNYARQVTEAALFESGRVFSLRPDGRYCEEERLAIGLMGPVNRAPADKQRPVTVPEIFFWLKGLAENLASWRLPVPATHGGASVWLPLMELKPLNNPCFESGQAVSLALNGIELGVMGILSGRIAAEWRFNAPVAVLEVAMAPLLPPAGRAAPQIKTPPSFPSVRRDLAMVLPQNVSHQEVMRTIADHAPPELTSVALFDIFTGKGIESGMKSMAYAFTYRADDRTLTDDDVNRIHMSIREAVQKRLGATVRE